MKIRKALLIENNELVTPREYEETLKKCKERKEIRCSCGAKLSFVETLVKAILLSSQLFSETVKPQFIKKIVLTIFQIE